jgi:hypothetical protein
MGNTRNNVPAHCHDHQNGQQSSFFHCRLIACCPGGCWGNTEQVVAQWQRPVASGIALDMLHCTILRVLLQGIRMAIKMACDGGTFACCRHLFCLL